MLARLLLEPTHSATMAELARASAMSKASLHRELMRAVDAGLVARDESRRPHEFRAVTASPLHEPVAALLRMTVGVEAELRRLLTTTPGVAAAAIHGPWADRTARPESDVDLLVLGEDVEARTLRADLRKIGAAIGREIDLMLVSRRDLEQLLHGDNPFLRLVLERPLVDLVGDVRRISAT